MYERYLDIKHSSSKINHSLYSAWHCSGMLDMDQTRGHMTQVVAIDVSTCCKHRSDHFFVAAVECMQPLPHQPRPITPPASSTCTCIVLSSLWTMKESNYWVLMRMELQQQWHIIQIDSKRRERESRIWCSENDQDFTDLWYKSREMGMSSYPMQW